MVLARVEKLNPSHRFAAGSRPKGHRTFGLSLAPPIHQAMGGQGFSTLASTNSYKWEHRPRKWHETVADTHLKGWIFHTFTGKPWTMSTKMKL